MVNIINKGTAIKFNKEPEVITCMMMTATPATPVEDINVIRSRLIGDLFWNSSAIDYYILNIRYIQSHYPNLHNEIYANDDLHNFYNE